MTERPAMSGQRLRVLVAIASYGSKNDPYLLRVIQEYQSMSFDVKIVILSNIDKHLWQEIEVIVGLPSKDPWSLPFGHKKLFADRADGYDLFIYSEDDILITESNLWAFLQVTSVLQGDEIAGFLRIEHAPNGGVNYPEMHAHFHWDPQSVRTRGHYTLAFLTNEHAACYVLTQDQLKKAVASDGFLVGPHESKYDLLCAAATDPYTRCGFQKLIPISHFEDFTVIHLPNKYLGKLGVDGQEFRKQIDALMEIAENTRSRTSLLNTETKLAGAKYSKNYYEPLNQQAVSQIPNGVKTVFSFGCGSGLTEVWLVEHGLRVVAAPLDSIISHGAAESGVE